MNETLKKYGTRLAVGVLVFFFFKVTSPSPDTGIFEFNARWTTMLVFTVFVTVVAWEIIDAVIHSYIGKYPNDLISRQRLVALFFLNVLFTFPMVTLAMYFYNYQIKPWMDCPIEGPAEFWAETVQGYLLACLVIASQLLALYHQQGRKMERDRAKMQEQLLRSRYEALKNQVNPHFLFNSFSVLTSLIHQDADLASDYVTQLSKMYRYMLDNKANQMASLEKEIEFVNSYIFLLKTRYEQGVDIRFNINLDKSEYYIPTLSLQMLIENAIKHNSFSRKEPLIVNVYNDASDYLVVQNEVKTKNSKVRSTKIGLDNIKKRYGIQTEKQLVVDTSDDRFTVKLPILTSLRLT